jgi:hypothetical protein
MPENNKSRFIDNGDGTVTDSLHNRMWMKSDTWVELGRLLSWHQSQEYARKLNEEKFAGYGDWHIPTASEAKLLFDQETRNTDVEGAEIHIDPIFTSGCGFTTWTSETRGAKAAMGYDFRSDYEFWLAKENDGFPSAVRLVRALSRVPQNGDEVRFVDNGDGTISDHETGLMWKADDSYLDMDKWVTWAEAKVYVQGLNRHRFAGYTDWNMPTRKEAQSIYDPGNAVTDAYGDMVFVAKGFPPGSGLTCWTRTLHKTDPSLAMRFHFYTGDYKWNKKGLRSHGVRAVRPLSKD